MSLTLVLDTQESRHRRRNNQAKIKILDVLESDTRDVPEFADSGLPNLPFQVFLIYWPRWASLPFVWTKAESRHRRRDNPGKSHSRCPRTCRSKCPCMFWRIYAGVDIGPLSRRRNLRLISTFVGTVHGVFPGAQEGDQAAIEESFPGSSNCFDKTSFS